MNPIWGKLVLVELANDGGPVSVHASLSLPCLTKPRKACRRSFTVLGLARDPRMLTYRENLYSNILKRLYYNELTSNINNFELIL